MQTILRTGLRTRLGRLIAPILILLTGTLIMQFPLGVTASPAIKAAAISALDRPVNLSLDAGEEARLSLLADGGTLVHLSLSFDRGDFDVRLVNGKDQHVRQFLKDGKGRRHIVFVMPDDHASLAVTADASGTIEFNQTGRINKAEQVAPAPTYLSPRITALADALSAGENTAAFWAQVAEEGTPMVESTKGERFILTFLARGADTNVRLLGGPTNDIYDFERLGDSDVWFLSFEVPSGALFSYKIAPDVPEFDGPARQRRVAILAKAMADPLNTHPWPVDAPDAYKQSSTYRLEGGSLAPWHDDRGSPKGTLTRHHLTSEALGNTRDVWLYRSAGFDTSNVDTPLLILFDAESYREDGHVLSIVDNLVAAGALPPLAVALVSPIDLRIRAKELPNDDAFADLIAKDLLALVTKETGLTARAARTVLAGSSFGGLGSTTIALKHPDTFGNVLSLSGSYWWSPQGSEAMENYVAAQIATEVPKPIRFFLAAGLFETARDGSFAGILLPNRHLRDLLIAKGYEVEHREYPAGHDIFAWREILPLGLIALIGQ